MVPDSQLDLLEEKAVADGEGGVGDSSRGRWPLDLGGGTRRSVESEA